MLPSELAQKYMDIFFSGENLDDFHQIFADNFFFRGPFYTFDSASDYIDSLKSSPPIDCEYKIIKSYEDESSVCLIYEFYKPDITTTIMQTFEIEHDKISKILLIFDTGAFK